ncbi:unnamed protein product [Discosporangium mesarthrocarpum]
MAKMAILPLHAPLFSKKAKGKTRLVFRGALLLSAVVIGILGVNLGLWEPLGSHNASGRKLLQNAEEDGADNLSDCGEAANPVGYIAFYIVGILYMFLALAIICDEYFVPALERIADKWGLGNDVAGATLMAAGGSAPELFTSLFGTFQESDVGFGTIVGSAVFNVLFVIGMCAIFSKEVLSLTWWPLARDCTYYAISLGILALFFGGTSKNEIHLWEALVLLAMYGGYVLFMWRNEQIYGWVCKTFNLHSSKDDIEDENATFLKPSTFRAGILHILTSDGDMFDTAGVHIVARIAGDVRQTFVELDKNGDGKIDQDELELLLKSLGTKPRPEDVQDIILKIDEDHDNQIDFDEFTAWYIRSEERLRGEVTKAFQKIDTNESGTINREDLHKLLSTLGDKPREQDLMDAMKDLDKTGDGQITFEEFHEWYHGSMFWTVKQKEAEEAAETAEGINPFDYPAEGNLRMKIMYIVTFPLMFAFWLTMPDVHKPSSKIWRAYASFFLSILWIGVFSYFMVNWAEVVGATIGIPPVVMGLTILAAGTSVPDLLSSVIVARQGEGDMAVSSSIGSNIFDVLVGLPLPWFAFNIINGRQVMVTADNLFLSVIILILMLILVIITIIISKWKMTRVLGYSMFVLYGVFVAQDLARVTDWGC